MSQYYFVVSSLPLLRYDEPPPFSLGHFLGLCREWLGTTSNSMVAAAELKELKAAAGASSVLDSWRVWETNLRNELAKIRAQRKGVDPFSYLAECQWVMGLADLAQEAMGAGSPLEAENVLDRARWRYLEELEVGHHFDTEKLVLYSLKLQLLQRRALFQRDEGEQQFSQIIKDLSAK